LASCQDLQALGKAQSEIHFLNSTHGETNLTKIEMAGV
jgi:hypothetical protein